MKKMLGLVLALLMLTVCASAEETAAFEPTSVEANTTIELDLNGDGVTEQIAWTVVPLDEYDDEAVVTVQNASGEEIEWHSDRLSNVEMRICDLDNDGVMEILVSGDEMSDDYLTFALHYNGESFKRLSFFCVARGLEYVDEEEDADYIDADGFSDAGYGMVTAIDGNEIALTGSQDMLGTWMATRRFTLIDGKFELADNGFWTLDLDLNDSETWEYCSLTAVQPISVMFIENDAEIPGEIQTGDKVLPTAFDKYEKTFFVTEDGCEGYFTVELDKETGWGWKIGGVSENDLFETIRYAD